jgi:isopenicillin-N N-acyltransferase-like protein
MSSKTLPIIDVRGGPSQRGREQGEGAKALIHTAMDRYREILPSICQCSWEGVVHKARSFLPPTQEAFPDFIQELEGIAEGAHVPLEDIWVLNCYQELLEMEKRSPSCTSLVVGKNHTSNGHVTLAHNEDWLSADRDTVYLVRAQPEDGPSYLGMTYGPLLVNIGFNEAGIGVAINSVFSTDKQTGVPRILYSRAILNAQSIEEALQVCLPQNRAGGYHYLLGDRSGTVYSIESSATHYHIDWGVKGWLLHTNHYLSTELKALETRRDLSNSQLRFHRAHQLLEPQLGSLNLEALQSLLRDHANRPNSICEHDDPGAPPYRGYQTVASIIMDLTEGVMWAAPGPPCQHAYTEYTL